MTRLSHHEGHVLALIWKWQPTTAYFVRKTMEKGVASTFSSSPGSVYPAIERLKARGLVTARTDAGDGRKAEHLRCSTQGEAAVRLWVTAIDPVDRLPEDPWRTRMAYADLLSPSDLRHWLDALRLVALDEAAAIAERADAAESFALAGALEHARMATEARLAWIERMMAWALQRERRDAEDAAADR